eukprot:CAMPEP_0194231238 /NCGR_PEP_ID=MMETSP0158-20130606/5_1 /TAXON_ID=33649 /ORGANISM="Thalassionema nitzschioides, Strain L26-B" /LENGTH=130 /DNA_ID=CAMNT_0038963853 /DNA_START=18 /DNA_END=407 /DNA_ORIENTATION=+
MTATRAFGALVVEFFGCTKPSSLGLADCFGSGKIFTMKTCGNLRPSPNVTIILFNPTIFEGIRAASASWDSVGSTISALFLQPLLPPQTIAANVCSEATGGEEIGATVGETGAKVGGIGAAVGSTGAGVG